MSPQGPMHNLVNGGAKVSGVASAAATGLTADVVVGSSERAVGAASSAAAGGVAPDVHEHEAFSVRAEIERYGRPLVDRLRGPKERWPTKEDFFAIPRDFAGGRLQRQSEFLTSLLADAEASKACGDSLIEASLRAYPEDVVILPVAVAFYCMSELAGFPEKLVLQSYLASKALATHIDSRVRMKGDLLIAPRAPQVGVAAPGSKKTPVQMVFFTEDHLGADSGGVSLSLRLQ